MEAYVPHGLRGEFHIYDSDRAHCWRTHPYDCSINWTDPDDGRVYCFNSATSLVYFENWPKTYSHKAADALERMKKDTPEHRPLPGAERIGSFTELRALLAGVFR